MLLTSSYFVGIILSTAIVIVCGRFLLSDYIIVRNIVLVNDSTIIRTKFCYLYKIEHIDLWYFTILLIGGDLNVRKNYAFM